eukprot:jgi/Orpsp1_1/1182569/evm.model.c7180000081818.1
MECSNRYADEITCGKAAFEKCQKDKECFYGLCNKDKTCHDLYTPDIENAFLIGVIKNISIMVITAI